MQIKTNCGEMCQGGWRRLKTRNFWCFRSSMAACRDETAASGKVSDASCFSVFFTCCPQFFQRTQMQTARPTIPTNTPSIRPGSQAPTAAVYPTNSAIVMTMAPMPFPSPQAAQYYIPQVQPTHLKMFALI